MASITLEQSIKSALSPARVGTYEIAATVVPKLPVLAEALALYAWNAQVSAALMMPLHICEVVGGPPRCLCHKRFPWSSIYYGCSLFVVPGTRVGRRA
jgi:hypothetical protein